MSRHTISCSTLTLIDLKLTFIKSTGYMTVCSWNSSARPFALPALMCSLQRCRRMRQLPYYGTTHILLAALHIYSQSVVGLATIRHRISLTRILLPVLHRDCCVSEWTFFLQAARAPQVEMLASPLCLLSARSFTAQISIPQISHAAQLQRSADLNFLTILDPSLESD